MIPSGFEYHAPTSVDEALGMMGLEELTWEDGAEAGAGAGTETTPATAVDPICGMEVKIEGAQHTHEYGGRTWYFCCDGCRAKFAADAAAWAAA